MKKKDVSLFGDPGGWEISLTDVRPWPPRELSFSFSYMLDW